jgi:hypothetical protein
VDAICINQKNLVERSQQVQIMGIVYARAFCRLAWLGPESKNDRLAFDLAEWLSDTLKAGLGFNPDSDDIP